MAPRNEIKIILTADSGSLESKSKSGAAALRLIRPAGAQAKAGLDSVKNSAQSTADSLGQIKAAAVGLFAVSTITQYAGEFIATADAMRNMDQRLLTVSKNTNDYAAAQRSVVEVARDSHQDLGAVNTLYSRMAQATDNLNVTQKELATVTKTVALSVVLSGSSAVEATAGLIQFSQAMGASRLGGDELRSVLENMPQLTKVFVDAAGGSMATLRKMAEEGKLTTEWMLAAIKKAAPEIEQLAAGMPLTVGRAMTDLKNEASLYIASVDNAHGFTVTLAGAIKMLGDNLETVANGGVVALTLGTSVLAGRGLSALQVAVSGTAASLVEMATVTVAANAATTSTSPAVIAAAAARTQATRADMAAAAAKIVLIREEQAQVMALFAEGRATESAALGQAAFTQTTVRLAAAQVELTAATAANIAAQRAQGAVMGTTAALSAGRLLSGLVGLVNPVTLITTVVGLGALAWMQWGDQADTAIATAEKRLAETKRINQQMKEISDPGIVLQQDKEKYQAAIDVVKKLEALKLKPFYNREDRIFLETHPLEEAKKAVKLYGDQYDETQKNITESANRNAALQMTGDMSLADFKKAQLAKQEYAASDSLGRKLKDIEKARLAEIAVAAKQFKDEGDLSEATAAINKRFAAETSQARIEGSAKSAKAQAKDTKDLEKINEEYHKAVMFSLPEEQQAVAKVREEYADKRTAIEEGLKSQPGMALEAAAAMERLAVAEEADVAAAINGTEAKKAYREACERQVEIVDEIIAGEKELELAAMSESERAVAGIYDKNAALDDLIKKQVAAGNMTAEMGARFHAVFGEQMKTDLAELRKAEADKEFERITKAAKESNSALAGFSAAAKELSRNMHTLGQVGADAFGAISGGVTSSISTSLKYMVHGLSDAKDLLEDSRNDSITAADQANQEMLADLENSYATGTLSATEYEQKKTDILQNYTESRQKIQEDYNKGVIEAEEKLGVDLRDIWTGVLDSMTDSVSKWMSDLAMEFVLKDIAAPALNSLGLDISGLLGGPDGSLSEPFYVNVINGGTGGAVAGATTGIGSGSYSDMLGTASVLSNTFEGGSGWDKVGTDMGNSMATAVNSNVDFTGAAVDAFGTTSSAWDTAGKEMGEAFTGEVSSTDVWGKGTLDSIQARDMLNKPAVKPAQSTIMGEMKPYLQGASAVMAAYVAYNQYKQGNYLGAGVSGLGAASNAYQAGSSAGLYSMGAGGTAAVAGAGVVGGAYGVYSGIKDISENGLTLSNGAMTALSAYSTYASASALYASMGGTAFVGAGGISAITGAVGEGLTAAGTYIASALTSTATTAATAAATTAATTATAAGSGAAAGGGAATGTTMGAGASLGPWGVAAAAAWMIIDAKLVNHDFGVNDMNAPLSNGGTYTYGSEALDKGQLPGGYKDVAFGSAQMNADYVKDGTDIGYSVDKFRQSMDVLTNQFNSNSAEIYRALESGAISFEQYAESVSGVDITVQQASQMQNLASQAASGSTVALQTLRAELEGIGVGSTEAGNAALAMTSAVEAQASGFRTSTVAVEMLTDITGAYIDRIALVDVSLERSTAIYSNARAAMAGSDEALSRLTTQFEEMGMSSGKAAREAEDLTKAMDMGANGLAIMASGMMEAIPAVTGFGGGAMGKLQEGIEDADYAIKALGLDAALASEPLAGLVSEMDGMYPAIGSVQAGLEGLNTTAFNTASTVAAINNPLGSLTDHLGEFGDMTWGVNEQLKLAMQGNGYGVTTGYANGGAVGYAGGGVLEGGSGVADDLYMGTVNGRAQLAMGGEYFMPPAQTRKHLSALEAMRADRYATGGPVRSTTPNEGTTLTPAELAFLLSQMSTPAVQSSRSRSATSQAASSAKITATTKPGTKSGKYPMVDAVLSELGAIMRAMNNVAGGAKAFAIEMQGVKERYAEAYVEAQKLGASEDQLMRIRMAQAIEIKKARAEHAREIEDMLAPYRQLNSGMSEFQIGLEAIKTKYRDAILAGKEMGMGQSQLNEIWAAQGKDLKKYADDIKKPFLESARELIATNGMTDVQKQAWSLDKQYRENIATMKEAGATAGELALMDKARTIEMINLRRESLKEEDFATRVDYQRALYSMPAASATAVAASLVAPASFAGTDYVSRDMIAQGEPKYSQRADETNADLIKEVKQLNLALAKMQGELMEIKRTNKRICDITEKSDAIGPAPARAVA